MVGLVKIFMNRYGQNADLEGMKRKVPLCAVFLVSAWGFAWAQPPTPNALFPHRNSVYFEWRGYGPRYSLNYDRVVVPRAKLSYGFRAGFSYAADYLSWPAALYAMTTPGVHHLLLSVGGTAAIERWRTWGAARDISEKTGYFIPGIGYRFQRPRGGPVFSLMYTPHVYMDPPSDNFWNFAPQWRPWRWGATLGWSF